MKPAGPKGYCEYAAIIVRVVLGNFQVFNPLTGNRPPAEGIGRRRQLLGPREVSGREACGHGRQTGSEGDGDRGGRSSTGGAR